MESISVVNRRLRRAKWGVIDYSAGTGYSPGVMKKF